jgi:rod shape-determining protein MreD
MRLFVLVLLPFVSLFLQSTILANYSINGTVPDMVLIFVVFYALLNGSGKGTVYGLLCGLLEDLYMGRFIGFNAVSKAVVAYVVSKYQGNVFRENLLVGVTTVLAGTIINAVVTTLIALASFQVFNLTSAILTGMLYQIGYNTLLSIPLYIWYYNSNRTGLLRQTGD